VWEFLDLRNQWAISLLASPHIAALTTSVLVLTDGYSDGLGCLLFTILYSFLSQNIFLFQDADASSYLSPYPTARLGCCAGPSTVVILARYLILWILSWSPMMSIPSSITALQCNANWYQYLFTINQSWKPHDLHVLHEQRRSIHSI
jgi:hypothetical protein